MKHRYASVDIMVKPQEVATLSFGKQLREEPNYSQGGAIDSSCFKNEHVT